MLRAARSINPRYSLARKLLQSGANLGKSVPMNAPRRVDVSERVALVTGASSGIGLSVTEKLLVAGARVALVARRQALLDEHVARFGSERAAAFALDVTDLEAVMALPGRVVARFGRLDILVNNAGLNHRGPILRHSARDLGNVITTNLTAPIVL